MSRVLVAFGVIAGCTRATDVVRISDPDPIAVTAPQLVASAPQVAAMAPAPVQPAVRPRVHAPRRISPVAQPPAVETPSEPAAPIAQDDFDFDFDFRDASPPADSDLVDTIVARGYLAPAPRRYGVMLDLGVPDGATAAIVLRPVRAIRLDAGISYNGISHGERGGITFIPFASWISPTLSLDYGHYADGDANPLVRLVTGNPMFSSPALARVGYDYADAHVGIELGRKAFTFYVHAGASRVTGSVHDLGLLGDPMSKTKVTFGADPTVTLTTVSARLGFIFYFGK